MTKIKETDKIVLICAPKKSGNTVGIDAFCVKCDCDIWISDSTINSVKQQHPGIDLLVNKPDAYCIDCGKEHLRKIKNPEVIPLTEEQINEIKLARK